MVCIERSGWWGAHRSFYTAAASQLERVRVKWLLLD